MIEYDQVPVVLPQFDALINQLDDDYENAAPSAVGMNALGWSHEQAMTYMAQHTLCNETEIYTDTLRYSCSIPGQALAYKLGDEAIMGMREKMQDRLRNKFDFRAFHSAILKVGSIPIPVLEWHLDWYADQQLSA